MQDYDIHSVVMTDLNYFFIFAMYIWGGLQHGLTFTVKEVVDDMRP